jgi:capsular polysaccharide export protein
MLQNAEFPAAEQQRAERLRLLLLQHQVTKYNLGRADWRRPDAARVILVPGQVESDASIKLGSPVLKTNLALLQAVRAANPDAYIVYKPHPDVLAGLRKAGDADKGETASHYCDEMVTDQDIATLLEQVDEVHTLTSLAGFEALLRGKVVTCYGQPFYSGWGLTHDIYPNPRRGVQRSLPELIAAALIRYPTYLNWDTGYYSTPEQTIEGLAKHRLTSDKKLPWWRYVVRKLLALKRF